MKPSLRKRAAWVPVVATALGASLMLPTAAHAAPLPSTEIAIAAGGSDTTAKVLDEIAPIYNAASATGFPVTGITATHARFYNIPPFSNTGFTVPGSYDCPSDVTWVKDPLAPAATTVPTETIAPFGSTAGRKYLGAENDGTGPNPPSPAPPTAAGEDSGCIDIARSSSAPGAIGGSGGDVAGFEYYAFALDAVGWSSTSLKAPAILTTAQLVSIYDCVIRDWSGVGGSPGPIKRYYPQNGSGTRSFFSTDVLGKSSSYTPPTVADPATDCDTEVVFIEENRGKTTGSGPTLVQGVAAADFDKAILPYSAAVWAFQESNSINPTVDIRGGAQLKAIDSVADGSAVAWNGGDRQYSLDTAGVINENNVKLVDSTPDYPGIRYVFNVLDNTSSRPGYEAAKQMVGFSNVAGGSKSPLCNSGGGTQLHDDLFAAVLSNKFAALSTTGPDASKNLAGSNCRRYLP